MITQRLVADHNGPAGTLTIRTNPADANSLAELMALQEELALRANVQTQGSIITPLRPENVPPPPAET